MLVSLSIRNVVLIDALEAVFAPGLCALTGETGAGKSILLEALALAAGARADRALVRAGAAEAAASAVFDIPPSHPARALLGEAGIAAEPGEPLILRRRLTADGRSQAWINDQPAGVALLKSVGEALVEVHGQHDGRGLLDPSTHRALLDAFARNGAEREAARTAWAALAAARERLHSLTAARDGAAAEAEFLRHALDELDRLAPQPGEEVALAAERKFLQQAEAALAELNEARAALDDGGLTARLNASLRALERVRDRLGGGDGEDGAGGAARDSLARAAGALDRALIEFTEAGEALADAAAAFDVEPGRLEAAEERLFALRAAARKHQTGCDDLPALRDGLAARLDAIDNAGGRVAEAEKAVKSAQAAYDAAASKLTASRAAAAQRLGEAVAAELPPLKLDKAKFRAGVETDPEREGPEGRDRVRFEVSTNPGAAFGPLDRIASGGELSRFALAIKVCLAAEDEGVTLIFDEVDQGVGGAVADAVGKRLARLAQKGQTLVVTHSPQVAARAAHHWKIDKDGDADGGVRTSLRALTGAERREEIARMLSGAAVTDAARAQAEQLMGAA